MDISDLHPNVRRFDLRNPCYIAEGCHGMVRGLLSVRVAEGPPLVGANTANGPHELDVKIEFVAADTPLAGVTVSDRWFIPLGTWFLWPKVGERLPVLVHFKKARFEGKAASEIIAIERAESLASMS